MTDKKETSEGSKFSKYDQKFHKLTPLQDVDISGYKDALTFVFEHDDIRNVALSGPYGAGKSSVLETYKKETSKKFLHISLADFKPLSPDKENDTSKTIETVLEGKILNQLLHQIPAEKIPQTGFHVKKRVTNYHIIRDTLAVIAFISLGMYHIFFNKWDVFVKALNWPYLDLTTSNSARFVLLLAHLGLLAWGLGYAVRKQRTSGLLKKVSLQGNEFEIGHENDESLFDKYLNEVLYLFENADTDVIVFEDLDRHESADIFTRLREINTLVNQQHPEKILRFFYLLRDDIFSTKDRSKFFDFIIPVVPVLDGSNSYDKFLEFFRDGGIEKLFTSNFLQKLSLYIDEMRLLKNIINEFQIYNQRLNTADLDHNKMLALITYKNIFPKDFADLQLNRGFVHKLFETVPQIISKRKMEIEKRIAELHSQLKLAVNAFLTDEELDLISGHYRHSSLALVNKLTQAKTFYAEKIKSEKEEANTLLEVLKNELKKLEQAKLRDVLSRENIDAVFCENQHVDANGEIEKYEEIKASDYFDLLKFLLRSGYINEGYADYMTYFYPESLSRNDKAFLLSVSNKKAKDKDYPLDRPIEVSKRLEDVDFEQQETLNFALLNALLSTSQNKPIEKIITQLKTNSNTEFVHDYLAVASDNERVFVAKLNVIWPEFFKATLSDVSFLPERRTLWAQITLCVSSSETIKAVNQEGCLCEFINASPEFLNGKPRDHQKLVDGMRLIGVKVKAVNREVQDLDIFNAIYEYDLYALNAENIVLMLNKFYNEIGMSEMGTRSYSIIMKTPESPLAKRIQANINDYLDIVFTTCGDGIEDDEKDIINILSNSAVSTERKSKYIARMTACFSQLTVIPDKTIWPDLLKCCKVKGSPENVLCYFVEKGDSIDDVLVTFINRSTSQELDFSAEGIFKNHQQSITFFERVVECATIADIQYEKILSSIDLHYPVFSKTGLPVEKVRILVRLKKIKMSLKSLAHMREHYIEVFPLFILFDFFNYINLFSDKKMDVADIARVIQRYDGLSNKLKSEAIAGLSMRISELISMKKALSLPLLDDLLDVKTISSENKVKLFAMSLDKVSDRISCQSYLIRLGLPELAKVLHNGRPKINDSTTNRCILDHFKMRGWIKDYELDTGNSGFLKVIKQKQPDNSSFES